MHAYAFLRQLSNRNSFYDDTLPNAQTFQGWKYRYSLLLCVATDERVTMK